jgi:hypothetical protein
MSEDIITRSRAVAVLSEIARNERNDVADRILVLRKALSVSCAIRSEISGEPALLSVSFS